MECDVIPDCTQEVDPLGDLENCDSLSDESPEFSLDAQIVSSTDVTYHVHPPSQPSDARTAASHPTSTNFKPTLLEPSNCATDQSGTRRKTQKTPTAKKKLARAHKNETTGAPTSTSINVTTTSPVAQASTMREVLASIPGFSMKPRRRTTKKMSTAAQIAQTREGCIDLETPDSILVGANLRSLLNKHTFLMLPPLFQYKLVQLLPSVDRPPSDPEPNAPIRLNASSLNNEFFARACLEWRERLSEGEFTPENQSKLKADAEKEKSRLDPWKLKHFEPIWGRDKNEATITNMVQEDLDKSASGSSDVANTATSKINKTSNITQSYTTISARPARNSTTFSSMSAVPKRSPRTVGAMTRASSAAVVGQSTDASVPIPDPNILPLRIRIPRTVNMNAPEGNDQMVVTKTNSRDQVLSVTTNDDTEPIVIPDDNDHPISTPSGLTVTISNTSKSSNSNHKSILSSAYTIPPGIEVIPLDNNQTTNSIKRAPKRSISPDRNQIKISKFNDDVRNPNSSRLGHHNRKPIPSSPSPSNLHNGTCAVSDVIQIIKLPEVSASKSNAIINDKQSRDKTSSPLQDPVPNMTVAVTTIAAPLNKETISSSSAATTTVAHSTARFDVPNHQTSTIEIIKRPLTYPSPSTALPSQSAIPAMFVSSYSNTMSIDEPRKDGMPMDVALESIAGDTINNDLDVDESSFSESPADHVFRAMVCHGDDVLCGDVIGHPNDSNNRSTSGLFQPNYETGSRVDIIEESVDLTDCTDTNDADPIIGSASEESLHQVQLTVGDEPSDDASIVVETAVEELEPSIQSLEPLVELDAIDQKFTDAVNYVLESGEISTNSVAENGSQASPTTICDDDSSINASLFAATMALAHNRVSGGVAGNHIQPSTQVPMGSPIHAHSSNSINATPTEVIPMQETLEVRLKESTFPMVGSVDWPFKLDRIQTLDPRNTDDHLSEINSEDEITQQQRSFSNGASSMVILSQQANNFATTSQVKLELEVTLTPDAEVSSSTLASNSSNSGGPFCDSDQSNEDHRSFTSSLSTVPTVIAPTTIVCLPSLTSTVGDTQPTNVHSTYISSSNFAAITKANSPAQSTTVFTNNHVQRPPVSLSLPPVSSQPNLRQLPVVASSSSLPFLSLASTQPLRAVPHHPSNINRPRAPHVSKSGRGNRGHSNRPPPGAVNLERSYQICQAVIQSSPNRHQLKAQLRPPPSMLGSGPTSSTTSGMTPPPNVSSMQNVLTNKKDESIPTKTANPVQHHQSRVAFVKKPGFIQRQPSPVLVRHVFTTNQGIPVSMAVLPPALHQSALQHSQSQNHHYQTTPGSNSNSTMAEISGNINQSGQYILVQRAAGVMAAESPAPRSSSAPPAQQHPQSLNHIAPIGARGRPASVDVDGVLIDSTEDSSLVEEGSPLYGDIIDQNTIIQQQPQHSMVVNRKSSLSHSTSAYSYAPEMTHQADATNYPQPNQFAATGENTPPNCSCSMNAMVICQQCGIFCHDQCMGSAKLCLSCVIR